MTTYLASVLASRNTKLPTFPSDLPPSSPSFLALLVFLSFYTASLRACLHGGGRPQMGEETCGGLPHLSCNRDQIKMRDYRNGRVTLPKRVSSPTWGLHLHVIRPKLVLAFYKTFTIFFSNVK